MPEKCKYIRIYWIGPLLSHYDVHNQFITFIKYPLNDENVRSKMENIRDIEILPSETGKSANCLAPLPGRSHFFPQGGKISI
jgi:hypothetical protein